MMRLALILVGLLDCVAAYPASLRRGDSAAFIAAEKPIRVFRGGEGPPPPAPSGGVAAAPEDDGVEGIKKKARDTLGRVKKVSIEDSVKSDADLIRRYFLPGLKFRWDIFLTTITIVVLSIMWFSFFYKHCYEDDRCENLLRWGIDSQLADEEPGISAKGAQLRPDVVIVFHHPDYKYTGQGHHATSAMMARTLVSEVDSWKVVSPDDEVPVRIAPTTDAPRVGAKERDAIVRGMSQDGWVALAAEDGFISIMTEGDGDEFEAHPSYPSPGQEAPEKAQPALQPLVNSQVPFQQQPFHRLRKLMKDGLTYENATAPLTHLRRARSALTGEKTPGGVNPNAKYVPEMPTHHSSRVALLQDLYDVLPKWGFDLAVFSSIDNDELFVCISLANEEAQTSYLLRQNTQLQVRKDVVRRLGIDQPPNENASSPPRLRFDPRIVSNLHEQGILANNDPRELYECYHGRDTSGCIVSGKDRFRMIFKELCNYLDLDAARHDNLVVDWYPCHSNAWLRRLDASWASFRNLCDLTFVQPICLVQDYFGSRLAFIFAWNGLYAKCLLCLSIFAICIEVCGMAYKHKHMGEDHIERTVNRRIVLAFSVSITIWARASYNMWLCEEEYFIHLWDLSADNMSQTVRPSFQGESKPSPADRNLTEKQYPAHMSKSRQICSALITILFCLVVVLVMMIWQNTFQDDMNIVASIVLAVIITIFSVTYNILVPILTDWENHKFQSQYYDSFLWKQFMFQTVNRYFAFFQIAVKQRYTAVGCPPEGCLAVLRMQLVTTLAILSVTRIFEVIFAALVVRFKIWLEDYWLRRSQTEGRGSVDERSYIELQCKFVESRLQEQIQNMLQLVLSLGFVLLFGAVAPIITPFCLAVFMVQLRATAFVLIKYTKRTLPRQQLGIGLWRWIISCLMQASILFCGFLIAVYSDTFEGMPMITKMAGVLLYVMCMQLVCFMVDVFVPKTNDEVNTLADRRRRVKDVIMKRSENFAPPGPATRSGDRVHAQYATEVATGQWDKIPHYIASKGSGSP